MSLRLQMLQVSRLARNLLHDSADLVSEFLQNSLNADGGFGDRSGKSDVYYTVFGLECMTALQMELPKEKAAAYLRTFEDGSSLDFVHACCLARAWASLGETADVAILDRIAKHHRTPDGGFAQTADSESGSVYAAFLAMGAYQDMKVALPDSDQLIEAVQNLRADDGGYANDTNMPIGSVPATAAAVALLHQLNQPTDKSIADWLLERCHEDGGFFAHPLAPIPDLLSTATALHALVTLHADIEPIREITLDFIDTLWSSKGGFCGSWTDETVDCEYTWYGLLSLGHLSL